MALSHRTANRVHDDGKPAPAPQGRSRIRPVPQSPNLPAAAESPQAPVYRVEGLTVDCGSRRASILGRQLDLTCMEFELIAHLTAHPDRVYTRCQLMELVWQQTPAGDLRTVDVHIARLRRKLGPHCRGLIRTVRQVGYALSPRLTPWPRLQNTT
ncbi:winged helix-turn-helix domain-containing protein [Streptomyces sp. NPDC058000]|uniref:winged helix-turn-helix domain-containing protein n=1 Tax=Streptomyces sp. NPDC058000 TaxID=3346299 RepID=UPI0036EDADE2